MTRDRPVDLADLCAARGWRDIVVKPAIGASAKGAERFTHPSIAAGGGPAQAHLDALLLHGHALVQPFQDAVNDARERSLVYIGGAFSHAFTKPPFLRGVGDGLGEQRHEPGAAERSSPITRSRPRAARSPTPASTSCRRRTVPD